jgi:DNA replication licensing factor MCM3
MQYIPAIDGALTQLVTSLHDPIKHDIAGKECKFYISDTLWNIRTDLECDFAFTDHVGLRGSFGQQHCNPRTLRSHQIGKMVSLEGIVTRCK